MANVGLLKIGMSVATGGLAKGLSASSQMVTKFGSGIQSSVGAGISAFGQLGLAINGVSMILNGITAMVSAPLKLAGEAEQTAISFEVLLGSAGKAKAMMEQLSKFAAETPFELPEVQESARALITYGTSTKDLREKMIGLGNIAAGLKIPLSDLAEIYGKNQTEGFIRGDDLTQLMGRGIPIVQALSDELGISASKVRELASEGELSFESFDKAMMNLGNNKFAGLMDMQSKSLLGVWSTLQSDIGESLTAIGTEISTAFNLTGVVTSLSDTLKSVTPTIITYFKVVASTVNAMAGAVMSAFGAISSTISGFVPTVEQLGNLWLGYMFRVEYTFANFSKIWDLGIKSSAYSMVKFGNQVQYIFTEYIIGAIVWTAKNWTNVLIDITRITVTVFTNLSGNIAKIFTNLPGLIKGNIKFADLWTPLTDGMELVLTEMPKIAGRKIGGLEQQLKDDLDKAAMGLVQNFDTFKNDKMKTLFPPTVKQDLKETLDLADEVQKKTTDPKAEKKKQKEGENTLAQFGGKEAAKAILQHQFGYNSGDSIKDLNKLNRQQLDVQRQQLAEMRKSKQSKTVNIPS